MTIWVKRKFLSKIAFICTIVLTAAIALLYFYNIVKWGEEPDYGYAFRSATGVKIIGVVSEFGYRNGFRIGDRIISVNNKSFSNISELRAALRRKIGEKNNYLIARDDSQLGLTVENKPAGLTKVFISSGLPVILGLCYVSIGILAFSMKPHRRTTWIFFLFCAIFGSLLMFLFKAGRLRPDWFGMLHIFLYAFTPAVIIQLALNFPERRDFVINHPTVPMGPYLASALLFISIRMFTPEMTGVPKFLFVALITYFSSSIIFFLLSCLCSWIKSPSAIVKARSKLILLGTLIGASVPLLDTVINALLNVYIVPSFNYYLPFLLVFPIVIAYSIIRHNLFDIDATVRRTYGYLIATIGISMSYTIFMFAPTLFSGKFRLAQSPGYSIIIILSVLLLFSLLRNRFQKYVDRAFYRLEYDYQEAIQKISETMRNLLKIEDIGNSIMDTALGTIYIDSGCVMLFDPGIKAYRRLTSGGERGAAPPGSYKKIDIGPENSEFEKSFFEAVKSETGEMKCLEITGFEFSAEEPFIRKLTERKKEITVYDVQEDPVFEKDRDLYKKIFEKLNATLIVPLIYEDRLTGFISLGHKLSGKFYCSEDINMLTTLANQGAIAIENARMVDKIIEKERNEAKIMEVFGKYVTCEVRDQVLEGRLPLDGEVRDVTILFADLRDFTTLAESTPPKEIVKILNGYFCEMAESVRMHHGLVLQFIGDEIEAVFGAPIELKNHPTFAVKAALEMRRRLALVNLKLQQQNFGPLNHGIGIHTGSAVAANIGSNDRMSYALVGDTVNLASRIQGLNKKFGTDILISETTKARLSQEISVSKLPANKVKGKREPVEIFKVN